MTNSSLKKKRKTKKPCESTHTYNEKKIFFVKPCFQPTVHPTNLVSLCSPVISYKWLPFFAFPFFFFGDASLTIFLFSYLPFSSSSIPFATFPHPLAFYNITVDVVVENDTVRRVVVAVSTAVNGTIQ
jgi:hypothetical protein